MKNHMHDHMSGGCPSARLLDLDAEKKAAKTDANRERTASRLTHWPVKLMLLPPTAPFLRGKELLLTADCVGVAHPELHNELMEGKAIAIACPKFDETEPYVEKLAEMAAHGGITGITVVHMEVPCCGGLAYMAKQAVEKSGTNIPVKTIIIGVRGDQLTK